MIQLQIIDYATLLAFWLSFTRWVMITFQLPLFDQMPVPAVAKVLTTLVLSYAFFPYTSPFILNDLSTIGIDQFWLMTIYEACIGLTIGFFVKAILLLYTAAGAIITQQIGFGAISYYDPTASQQVGPFEILIQWTVVLMILSSGALLPMFKGIVTSFSAIQLSHMGNFSHSVEFYLELFKSIFISALMLASPMIFTNILITSVLGIISRTVPQMNIIMVSFVVNIGLGLLIFLTTANEFFNVAYEMYVEKLAMWFKFIS